MELNRKNMLKLMGLITFAVFLLVTLQNFSGVLKIFGTILSLLSPFITGACIAFVLNVPMRLIEEKAFRRLNQKGGKLWERCRRTISLTLTALLILGLLAVLVFLIVPQMKKSIQMLISDIPKYKESVQVWLNEMSAKLGISMDMIKRLDVDWQNVLGSVTEFLKKGSSQLVSTTVNLTTSVISGVMNVTIGIVFAFYVLMQKERLGAQFKKLMAVCLKPRQESYLHRVGKIANRTFSNFVTGQVTEAFIIGALCFIGMVIFRMPYAAMISVLVGVTALIPVFGAFFGTAVGAFLILMVSPSKALWFIVFIIVLQQLEGDIIYPRVVGSSVGLPSIWVLVAVTVGGSSMGITGMLIGIPIVSLLYAIFKEAVNERLEKKAAKEKKTEALSPETDA